MFWAKKHHDNNMENFKELMDTSPETYTKNEQEYLGDYKTFLADNNSISGIDRRLLDKISKSLNISPERVKQLEESCLSTGITKDEQECKNTNGSMRNNIEDRYHELVSILEKTREKIGSYSSKHKNISKLQEEMFSSVDNEIVAIEKEIDNALNCISWDNLVIAFFGETNAGKSTIIETFRILFEQNRQMGQDGLIVGDGQQDFTKDYHEYSMSISGKPFTLIDVPGIEGNEEEFRDVIQNALHKAHCVFYVQGHNKKPDSKTAHKIKKYLGDWVNVYSIQNVRGGVSNYDEEEERETLLTPSVLKNEALIKETFKEILGDVYKGHITLQALLAMCAKASFSTKREDLIGYQKKLLGFFGCSDELLRFSQFTTIRHLVENKASNFTEEIAESNKQKMMSLATRSANSLENVISNGGIDIDMLEQKLREFKRDVLQILNSLQMNIKLKAPNIISMNFSELKSILYSDVDRGYDFFKKSGKNRLDDFRAKIVKDLENMMHTEIINAVSKIDNKKKELSWLKLSLALHIDRDVIDDIDLSDALGELDLHLDKIGDFALATAGGAATGATIGSVVPIMGTLAGAVIGAIVGATLNVRSSDGGRSEAKAEISNILSSAEKKHKIKIQGIINSVTRIVFNEQKKLCNEVDLEIKKVMGLSSSTSLMKNDLREFVKIIKHTNYGTI